MIRCSSAKKLVVIDGKNRVALPAIGLLLALSDGDLASALKGAAADWPCAGDCGAAGGGFALLLENLPSETTHGRGHDTSVAARRGRGGRGRIRSESACTLGAECSGLRGGAW